MKTITYDEFIKLRPCWLNDSAGRARLKRYAKQRENWSAVDILKLKRVSYTDRIWAVANANLISNRVWQLWSIECAEYALSLIAAPDERSVCVVMAARLYLDGKIKLIELDAARSAARAAEEAASAAARSAKTAASAAARSAASANAAAAWTARAAAEAAKAAAWAAAWAARAAAWAAAEAAWAAKAAAEKQFVDSLIRLLEQEVISQHG